MLEHHTSQDTASSRPVYQTQPPVSSIPSQSVEEARIEDFLDRVFARLVAVLPYEERQRRRAAMREQIQALIAAHVELGVSPEQAMELALTQFQRESPITAQASPLLKTQTTVAVSTLPSARPATLIALGAFGLPYIADVTKGAWTLWATHSANETAFYRFELLAVPLIAGIATGLLARKRAARGVLNALALMTVPAIILPGLAMSFGYMDIHIENTPFAWLFSWVPSPFPAVVGLTWWAGLGCLGAGAGSKLRNGITKGWKRLCAARQARKKETFLLRQNSVNRDTLLLESGGR